MFNYTNILDNVGEKVSNYSSSALGKISDFFGTDTTNFSIKILTLIFLLVAFFFSLKITQKVVKFGIIILIIILGVSLIYSLF